MSIGNSGRIVIEIDPKIKRQLYSTLARDGMTLKDWFLQEAKSYVGTEKNIPLNLASDVRSVTKTKNSI
ncbi:hypothetical protein [Alcaligenes faecalis]|uniref:Toxin-antitoxin system HicB family antitoxin n=1 Tax=Alcaligenes faecalis TaxID=511 RepID=A0AB33CZT9_ALCFA|nr:hypothetical protein [Alcaligenes faecalis]ASR89082.1 hypothetical protein AFA_06295 [Alcaligenes faecalis]